MIRSKAVSLLDFYLGPLRVRTGHTLWAASISNNNGDDYEHHRTILFAAIALALTGTTPVSAQGLSVGGGADVGADAGVKGSLPSAPKAGADVNAGAGADADVNAGAGDVSADAQGKAYFSRADGAK